MDGRLHSFQTGLSSVHLLTTLVSTEPFFSFFCGTLSAPFGCSANCFSAFQWHLLEKFSILCLVMECVSPTKSHTEHRQINQMMAELLGVELGPLCDPTVDPEVSPAYEAQLLILTSMPSTQDLPWLLIP